MLETPRNQGYIAGRTPQNLPQNSRPGHALNVGCGSPGEQAHGVSMNYWLDAIEELPKILLQTTGGNR
jgi:hypothetical protein